MPTDSSIEAPPAPAADTASSNGETSPSQEVLDLDSMFGGEPAPSTQPKSDITTSPIRPSQPGALGTSQRTYMNEEEKKLFRDMSNEAYNRIYPLWSQHQRGEFVPKSEIDKVRREAEEQAKQVKSERFYDHPKAYLLSEDYSNAQHDVAIYRDIVDHYRTALANVTAGKGFFRILPDEKEKFIIDTRQEIPASPQAHAYITAELSKFYGMQMQAEQNVRSLETNYGQRFTPIKQALDKVEVQVFEKFEKAPGFERAWKGELALYPRELQGLPEYRLLAKASVIFKAMELRRNANKQVAAQTATRPDTSQGGGAVSDAAEKMKMLDAMADRR